MNEPQVTHFADEYTLNRLEKLEAVARAAQNAPPQSLHAVWTRHMRGVEQNGTA